MVYFIQYTNPACYPPLEHVSRLFAEAGLQVVFLGAHVAGVEALAFPPHANIAVEIMPVAPEGWRQRGRYFRFAWWALLRTLRARPRWVYASDGWSYPIGLCASLIPGVRVILHEHDVPATSGSAWASVIGWARRRLARRAATCVIPQFKRAEQFVDECRPRRVDVVWNCPRRDECLINVGARPTRPLRLVYQGSITEDRPPAALIEAMSVPGLRGEVSLTIVGYETAGSTGRSNQLMELAAELGIGGFVSATGPLSRHAMISRSGTYNAGVALLPSEDRSSNLRNMVGASNKPFDYLSQGLALLMNDSADWREFYGKYGRSCDPEDAESIAAALTWFLEHPDETAQMGEAGRQRILKEWNYETQFEPVRLLMQGDAAR